MTFSHKMAILQQYPQLGQKVFTLKEYSGEGFNPDVADPYGGSLAMYEETFRELNGLIDKAIGKLK
jgi:protein arginine phosphatase